tara:strand:- start:12 stop:200 length:189 start_codon:yes stop_codon:yes gene_type:complete
MINKHGGWAGGAAKWTIADLRFGSIQGALGATGTASDISSNVKKLEKLFKSLEKVFSRWRQK